MPRAPSDAEQVNKMKKIAPILLIFLGIAEIIIAFTGVKLPLPIALILGILFIGLGAKALLDAKKTN